MNTATKNKIGAAGFALLILAGSAYAAWTHWPKPVRHHPALAIDVSAYDADQVIAFVRNLGDINAISPEDRAALFNKLKARFDKMDFPEKFRLMKAAMDAFNAGQSDPIVINGRELMKAYQHEMLVDYFHSDPDKRKKTLDDRINEQEAMETARKLAGLGQMFSKSNGNPPEDRLALMRQHIGQAIQDSMRNGTPEDRAMMTQFMLEMRQRRLDRGLKVLF